MLVNVCRGAKLGFGGWKRTSYSGTCNGNIALCKNSLNGSHRPSIVNASVIL